MRGREEVGEGGERKREMGTRVTILVNGNGPARKTTFLYNPVVFQVLSMCALVGCRVKPPTLRAADPTLASPIAEAIAGL